MPFWSNDTSRPPPPNDPPPRYAQVMRKVYPYSLRPIVLFTALLGLIWAVVMGVEEIRDMSSDNETQKLRSFAMIIAILYFVTAGAEAVLILIAILQKISFGRWIKIIAPIGFLTVFGAQIMTVVRHFALKSDLVNQCAANTVGTQGWTSSGVSITFDQARAESSCNSAWNRRTWAVIAWLIVSLILAGIFVSAALGYHRQLLDPNSVRTRRPEAYAMQPQSYPHSQYPPPPGQPQAQQGWMVPPYPGPPAGQSNDSQGYEKGEYHPSAEWANLPPPPQGQGQGQGSGYGGGGGYSVPSGQGHGQGPDTRTSAQMQDDAWARAQAVGPTAHLTGGGAAGAGGSGATSDERRPIRNEEEDEAWEQAKREGLTAHLTGQQGQARRD